jgi:hypothetical protein
VLLFSLACLSACGGPVALFLPTATVDTPTPVKPSPTVTRTPTIVWFPTKTTPTRPAQPSLQPTSNQHPGTGELVFRDLFDEPAEWQATSGQAGSITLDRRTLNFALQAPNQTLSSLRKTSPPPDFYLEVTANAALCRGEDAYGVLFRVNAGRDGYRLLLNCRGEMRLERIKGFEIIPLENWAPSTVLPGSPMVTRLGIWAVKNEFRIFANDIFQFSARDPVWTGEQIGLFARSASSPPLTVSFSDLNVRTVDPARVPTITPPPPTPPATPRRLP